MMEMIVKILVRPDAEMNKLGMENVNYHVITLPVNMTEMIVKANVHLNADMNKLEMDIVN